MGKLKFPLNPGRGEWVIYNAQEKWLYTTLGYMKPDAPRAIEKALRFSSKYKAKQKLYAHCIPNQGWEVVHVMVLEIMSG